MPDCSAERNVVTAAQNVVEAYETGLAGVQEFLMLAQAQLDACEAGGEGDPGGEDPPLPLQESSEQKTVDIQKRMTDDCQEVVRCVNRLKRK